MSVGADKWSIDRPAGHCVKTGRELGEGETFHAVLFDEGDGFRREDYCEEAWDGPPEGSYCCFKTKMPVKEKKKRVFVDDEVLVNFFERLADETNPARLRFRFVLALILMRKRLLRYEETKRDAAQELWQMRLGKDGPIHSVLNPHMTDEEIREVSEQLSAILHGDMGEFAPDDATPDGPGGDDR